MRISCLRHVAIATMTLLKLILKYFLVIECQREKNAQSNGISLYFEDSRNVSATVGSLLKKVYIVCFGAEDGGFWLTEVLFDKNGQNM